MAEAPFSIAETRETYLRDDGTTFTRSDIFIKLSVDFRDSMLKKLKGPALSVFLCIALHCNDSMKSYPALSTIEEETGYSRQAVVDAIKYLEGIRLVEHHHRHNSDGDLDSNEYTVRGFASMGQGVVNQVDRGWSTSLTTVVNQVDCKKNPSKKNPVEELGISKTEIPNSQQASLEIALDDAETVTANLPEDNILFDEINRNRKAKNQRAASSRFDSLQQKAKWRGATEAARRLYNGKHPEAIADWVRSALEAGVNGKAAIVAYVAKCAANQAERKEEPIRLF